MEQIGEKSNLIVRMLAELPYAPSPMDVIDAALDMAELNRGDVFADLGCGDGVVLTRAAERFAVFCVGFEIDRRLARVARENAKLAGLRKLIDVVYSDLFKVDLSRFNVIYAYPSPLIVRALSERIVRECSKGSRILVHDYPLDYMHPVRVTRIPSHAVHTHTIYLYKR